MGTTIGDRLRIERERLKLSQSSLGQILGIAKHSVMNYELGKRSPDANTLSAMAIAGADVLFILTGDRSTTAVAPSEDIAALLDVIGVKWCAGEAQNEVWVTTKGLARLLNYYEQTSPVSTLRWGLDMMNKVATHPAKDLRALHLQAVNLQGNGARSYPQLLIYLARTPPHTPWTISPSEGLKDRYELDAGEHNLPLVFPETSYLTPVLVLSDDELAKLKDGKTVTVKP